MSVINCKEIRNKEIEQIKKSINKEMAIKAVFIQLGDNFASSTYVKNKLKLCEDVGIIAIHKHLAETTTQNELIKIIEQLNEDDTIHGIMVQLPLPAHIDEEAVISVITPRKDIDGFTEANKGKLMVGDKAGIVPCTPQGIMTILKQQGISIAGKNVVIVGRSNIVGKPMAQLMINNGATVTVCNSKTNKFYLGELISRADIFISAIGQANYFNKEFFNSVNIPVSRLKNIVGIDVGINRDKDNKLCGDIDKELYESFKGITPVPSGVGIMTVCEVIRNIVKCYNS